MITRSTREKLRILLLSDHCFPAFGAEGAGLHPREFPSGSAYHLHDLLARGLAEEGHEVFYHLQQGTQTALPPGVQLVNGFIPEVDICHTIAGLPQLTRPAAQLSQRLGIPLVLTCHMLRERARAESNWIFVSSPHARTYHSARIVVNGIDPDNHAFSQRKNDYLVFIGAMNKALEKGLDVALALSERKGFRLIVAGTASDYETIQRISKQCAAAGAEYVGDVRGARKADLMARARAVLFPSRLNEGCPLVIMEAMLSGTPVLSSTCGSGGMVTPETGFVCDTDADWAAAIDRLETISPARCREIALDRYHYRRMTNDYVREYRSEIARAARYS
jgi:glycosyltransferase involved in cell wall biosynthesis